MADPLAARARDPDQLLRVLRQSPDPRDQQVPQRLGQPGSQLALTEQRFHEQRVALGAAVDRLEHLLGWLAAEEPGHEFAGVRAGQPAQFHPGDPADPVELCEQRPQRVGTVQLVGPVDHDDQQAIQGPLVTDQEGQQIPGRAVGPVRVLDDHDHRAGLGQLLQQDENLLEQPGPGLAGVTGPSRLAELREQPGQFPGCAAGQQRGDAVRADITGQVAEHRGEGGEWQAVHAELQAASGQHPRALAA
jgi:hypothetical protein